MFQIVYDPSSGSTELCLTEITRGGSQIFFVCLVGVWQCNFEPAVCVHGMTGWELLILCSHCSLVTLTTLREFNKIIPSVHLYL